MEPVTHLLTGAALGRTGFNRKTKLATIAMCLAAEAPDFDILAYFKGSVVGFAHHRGFTHTIWGVPLMAAAVVAFLWVWMKAWRRLRPERPEALRHSNAIPMRWGLLFGFACIAGYTHLLLDLTNNYGIRPFWPFFNRWYSWDIVFIYDPWILAALFLSLTLPGLFGLVNSEIGARQRGPRGRGAAIAGLLFVLLVWGVRDYQHRRAVAAMDALEYQGEIPKRIGAYPYPANPFKWHGVVETSAFYETVTVDSSKPEVDPAGRALVYYKTTPTDVTDAAQASYLGRAYMDWARFPLLQVQKKDNPDPGWEVWFHDVRFMYPERRNSALAAYVILDPQLRVDDEAFATPNVIKDRLDGQQTLR